MSLNSIWIDKFIGSRRKDAIRESKNNRKKHILEISAVLTAFIIFSWFTNLPAALGYSLLLTTPVGSAPSGIAYDPSSGNIYVANFGSNTVSVINSATNVVSFIAVGANPINVAAGNGNIYVANFAGNTVSVINSATKTVIATVPVGTNPTGIAFDATSGNIYVVSYTGNSVSVINSATNTVIATVPVGANPYGVAVGNGNVYVANFVGNTVSVISDSTNTVAATLPVGGFPTGIAFDATSGNIYVANFGSNTVSVINSATKTVIATVPVGANPYGVAVGNGNVYVANFAGNTVSVISDSTNTVAATIAGLMNPTWIAYNSANGNIYVVDITLNSVSIISPSTTPLPSTPPPTPGPTATTDTILPVFTPASDIAVFPTGILGAAVTYSVTATDDVGTPTITCDHPSGNMFPIGTTPVTCTAADSDSTNQATIKFNVHVYTPIEGAGVMVQQLNDLNYLSTGTITSLDAKLPYSITMIPGNSADAKFRLTNFVNEVNSKCCSDTGLTSKPFTSASANKFITEANDIAAATP